jgi:4-hydroxybenzoate polyprenyltransferase
MKVWDRLAALPSFIALAHTIFALPFAVGASALALRREAVPFSVGRMVWIVVAVAALRTAAMAWNRFSDRALDAKNPRTAMRELPRGMVSPGGALALAAAGVALFFVAAAALGPWPLRLAPVAVVIALGYSLSKRFTWATHLWLGVTLGGAPLGAWIAVTGGVTAAPVVLALAVACWVAGFDLIYACQDAAFDRAERLGSIPARFGVRRALQLSSLLHAGTVAGLVAFGALLHLGSVYYIGTGAIILALIHEHRIVSPHDLSRVNRAFFTFNGWVSLAFAVCTVVEAIR